VTAPDHFRGADLCPYCGAEFDCSTDLHLNGDGPPDAGALSICVSCERVAFFTGKGNETRAAETVDELIEILSPAVTGLIEDLRRYKRESGWVPKTG
jgi:hypothetical protein